MPAVWAVRVLARSLDVAVRDERPGQVLAQLGVLGVKARRLAQHLQCVAGPAVDVERGGQRLELLGRDRALARAVEFPGAEVHPEQTLTDFLVVRPDERGLPQCFDGLGLPARLGQLCGNRLEIRRRLGQLADVHSRRRSSHPRLKVRGVERPEPNHHLRDAARIAPRAPPIGDGLEVHARVGQQPLVGGYLGRLHERLLVVRLELENLLVEGARLRQEPVVVQNRGDADVLFDGLVDLAGAHVEIAERVGRIQVARLILDDAEVLRDGRFDLALAEQLLGISECGDAVKRHG